MRRRVGLIVFLSGLALAGWLAYSLFIDRQPKPPEHNAMPAVILALGLLAFGSLWMKK